MGTGMPLLSMNARKAARRIVEACRNKTESLVLTPAAKVAALSHGLSPKTLIRGMRAMNSLLPRMSSISGTKSRSGWESKSSWSPLTKLADRVIKRNNEHRAVG
jgi:hypothetical protein